MAPGAESPAAANETDEVPHWRRPGQSDGSTVVSAEQLALLDATAADCTSPRYPTSATAADRRAWTWFLGQLSGVLGVALPDTARSSRACWSRSSSGTNACSMSAS
ncbi:hypothetical protein FG87_37230 [Nocardia vulneris]|uniref:Uncharacterized protein n=1 Tax=Nocardia vulneris TaxID=1141657 RepID=A0ABR4Z512_9NOCA|nr:hypothetical protein FG87_37230 [Nocardia vulneris]